MRVAAGMAGCGFGDGVSSSDGCGAGVTAFMMMLWRRVRCGLGGHGLARGIGLAIGLHICDMIGLAVEVHRTGRGGANVDGPNGDGCIGCEVNVREFSVWVLCTKPQLLPSYSGERATDVGSVMAGDFFGMILWRSESS